MRKATMVPARDARVIAARVSAARRSRITDEQPSRTASQSGQLRLSVLQHPCGNAPSVDGNGLEPADAKRPVTGMDAFVATTFKPA